MFFSEYLEGSSNNKAIEIYNPSPNTVNLTNYVIYRYNNGSAIPSDSLFPQGTLAPGAVWVAGNPSAVADILNVSDTLHTITFYNGDDAMSLVQISPRVQLDVIGIIGVDPGTNWPVGTGATSEFTLVRMVGIQQGNTNWAVGATEYDVYPQNTFTFIGNHTMTSCIAPVAPVIQFATSATVSPEAVPTVTATVNISNVSAVNPTSVIVSVNVGGTTATGGGVDYTFVTDTLTWPANDSTAQTISISVVDDGLFEGNETVELELTGPTNNATIGGNGSHTLTIQDDDFQTLPIGTVNTVDSAGVADSLGLKCWVHGVVYGGNLRPAGLQFTIIDGTGGIGVFRATGSLGYTITETDSIKILGTVAQFNGLTQMNVDSVVLLSTGNALKTPTQITALDESTESDLIIFKNAWIVNPAQWTGTGSGFNVDVTDGTNTLIMRIDADVDLYTQPAPVGMFHVCGLGNQFDNSSPYTSGYQFFPRYIADIKLLPVAALGPDTSFCAGGATVLGSNISGDTYLWSTGATTQTITVSTAGTYSVIVTDTTLNEMDYDTVSVSILPLPVAAFTTNSSLNPVFSFQDNSTNGTTLAWDFGDGNTSTSANPTNTYANPGNYTVTLITTNACGSDTTTESITVLVGLEDGLQGQLSLYPNPNAGQ
ncbi:MAG TPA: PKD domain-containing protein, partial [Bacteroidia bacterium]|nr:PKD domain-containing protein [Bacteroidia bacterium]